MDVTAPMITLNGSDAINASKSTAVYTDMGATCTDNVDGPIDVTTMGDDAVDRNVDMGTEYTITYDCQDMAGNNATQKTRIVTIVDDTTKPVITITSPEMTTVSKDAISYDDPGATCAWMTQMV